MCLTFAAAAVAVAGSTVKLFPQVGLAGGKVTNDAILASFFLLR